MTWNFIDMSSVWSNEYVETLDEVCLSHVFKNRFNKNWNCILWRLTIRRNYFSLKSTNVMKQFYFVVRQLFLNKFIFSFIFFICFYSIALQLNFNTQKFGHLNRSINIDNFNFYINRDKGQVWKPFFPKNLTLGRGKGYHFEVK